MMAVPNISSTTTTITTPPSGLITTTTEKELTTTGITEDSTIYWELQRKGNIKVNVVKKGTNDF
jgi:hypothetical protein